MKAAFDIINEMLIERYLKQNLSLQEVHDNKVEIRLLQVINDRLAVKEGEMNEQNH